MNSAHTFAYRTKDLIITINVTTHQLLLWLRKHANAVWKLLFCKAASRLTEGRSIILLTEKKINRLERTLFIWGGKTVVGWCQIKGIMSQNEKFALARILFFMPTNVTPISINLSCGLLQARKSVWEHAVRWPGPQQEIPAPTQQLAAITAEIFANRISASVIFQLYSGC